MTLDQDARTRLRELCAGATAGPWKPIVDAVPGLLDEIEGLEDELAGAREGEERAISEAGDMQRLAEMRRDQEERVIALETKYETPGVKCGRGHDNVLPIALWDCPICTEQLQARAERAQAALHKMAMMLAARPDMAALLGLAEIAVYDEARAVLAEVKL